LRHAPRLRKRRERAINNLVDGVNRFPLTGAAAKNEYTGYELKMDIITCGLAVIHTVLAKNDLGDANGFTAMAAQNTAEALR